MYKLTNEESAQIGEFLRILCRLDRMNDAKRIAGLTDAALSIALRGGRLWDLVLERTKELTVQ